MKQPEDYKLKDWVSKRRIVGLRIHYHPDMSGGDDDRTYWILTSSEEELLRIDGYMLPDWLKVEPTHCSIAGLDQFTRKEIHVWKEFVEKEAVDLAEYERLKKKFED